jgi:hypothetical protein
MLIDVHDLGRKFTGQVEIVHRRLQRLETWTPTSHLESRRKIGSGLGLRNDMRFTLVENPKRAAERAAVKRGMQLNIYK